MLNTITAKRFHYKEVIKIAFPAILESLFSVIILTIDTKMISVLGSDAISAISFTGQPKLIFYSIFFALGTTLSVFVAQSIGQSDTDKANQYLHSILKLTIILSLIIGILCAIFAYPIMSVCSKQKETLDTSVEFFRIIMGFMIFQMVTVVLNGALRGTGNTKATLYSNILSGIIDIIFNYLLIEGHLGFPALGAAGDAIATVMGSVAACAVSFFFITKKSEFLSLKGIFSIKLFSDPVQKKEILTRSGNMVFENIFSRIGFLLNAIILSTLPPDTTSVYHVGIILLNYSFAFGDGLQSAVVALAGKSFGKNDYPQLKSYVQTAEVLGFAFSIILCILYISGSRWFFGMYFTDPLMIIDGTKTATIVGIITIVQIIRMVIVAGIRSTGETKIPRNITTGCVLIINPSTAFLFANILTMGVWGIWLSNVITQVLWFISSAVLSHKHMKQYS